MSWCLWCWDWGQFWAIIKGGVVFVFFYIIFDRYIKPHIEEDDDDKEELEP